MDEFFTLKTCDYFWVRNASMMRIQQLTIAQDSKDAHFSPCAFRVLSAIVLGALILACAVALLPATNFLKRWTEPLVEEYPALNTVPIKQTPLLPLALLTTTILGASVEVVQLVLAPEWIWDVICLAGWVRFLFHGDVEY
jgi:hypothetical protein